MEWTLWIHGWTILEVSQWVQWRQVVTGAWGRHLTRWAGQVDRVEVCRPEWACLLVVLVVDPGSPTPLRWISTLRRRRAITTVVHPDQAQVRVLVQARLSCQVLKVTLSDLPFNWNFLTELPLTRLGSTGPYSPASHRMGTPNPGGRGNSLVWLWIVC